MVKGDRVGLLLPNCPQFLIAQFGVWKAGGIVVALNPIYTERELELPLTDTGVAVLVTLTRFYGRVKAVQPRTAVRRVIATNIKEYLPPLLGLLFTLFREKKDGHRISLAPGDSWFTELLLAGAGKPPPAVVLSAGRSGSHPLERRHDGHAEGRRRLAPRLRAGGPAAAPLDRGALRRPGSIDIMLPLPLFHVYANVGVQALAFIGRNPLALVPNPRDLDDLLATITQVKPAFFNGVPTLYTALLNHPDVRDGKCDFSSIKLCFSGAAALMAETKRQFEELTGGRIIEGYSLTEGMMACCVNPVRGTEKIGSVGMPLPDVDVRIVDADDPTQVLDSDVGEILIRAPQLMQGYWNKPGETARVLRGATGGRHVAAHRRSRLPRRGRLRVHRRSQEGPDQDERLPGVAARDRGSARRAPVGARGRRRRRARPGEGRSGEGVGRAQARRAGDGR